MRNKVLVLIVVLFTLGSTSAVDAASAPPQVCNSDLTNGAKHGYEVFTAYLANSMAEALWPYYKLGRSKNDAWVAAATNRLESRYYDQARAVIEKRVAGWPRGIQKVPVPHVEVTCLNTYLSTDTALLTTTETWKVTTKSGKLLYAEKNQTHHITMHRVPGLILHKWVVTSGV